MKSEQEDYEIEGKFWLKECHLAYDEHIRLE